MEVPDCGYDEGNWCDVQVALAKRTDFPDLKMSVFEGGGHLPPLLDAPSVAENSPYAGLTPWSETGRPSALHIDMLKSEPPARWLRSHTLIPGGLTQACFSCEGSTEVWRHKQPKNEFWRHKQPKRGQAPREGGKLWEGPRPL